MLKFLSKIAENMLKYKYSMLYLLCNASTKMPASLVKKIKIKLVINFG